jgi:hypothetical protein
MNNHKVINLFPVPIIQISFDRHDEYHFEDVEKSVKLPEGWKVPVNSSFPKILDDDTFISPIIRDCLIIDLTKCIKNTFDELNIPSNIFIDGFWYNIYHDNQGQEEHDHLADVGIPNAFWSGIYYNKNASSTIFTRSDNMYKTQLFEGYETSGLWEAFDKTYHTEANDGDIVLFPPYLEHYVKSEDRHKNNMRLTFTFNVGLFTNFGKSLF